MSSSTAPVIHDPSNHCTILVDGYRLFQQLVRVGCLDAWRNQSCPSANLYSFCSGYEYRLGAVDALGQEVDCSSRLRRNDDLYSVAQV